MRMRDEQASYGTAQVCLNGHTITKDIELSPELASAFCPDCAEPTVTTCECGTPIRGRYNVPGVIGFGGNYSPPSYCHACARPFPWTTRHLEAARELIAEMDELDSAEQNALSKSLDDLLVDTPKTQVAAIRFKKYAAKSGAVLGNALRDIMVDVMSETAKKAILG